MKTIKLKKLYDKAGKEAISLLKAHLLYMWSKRGNKFDAIINSMGTTAFYKNNNPLWEHEEEKLIGYKKLNSFMLEWNDIFKLTGYPIKIDEEGNLFEK